MTVTDALGRSLLSGKYHRVISLVPSITTYLYELLAGQSEISLVGRTKFCDHPTELLSIPQVGGTKQIHLDRIAELKPDLIILNQEENTIEIGEQVSSIAAVHTSSVITIQDAYQMMLSIGQLLGLEESAKSIIREFQSNFTKAKKELSPKKVAYLIWQKPYMSVGHDTFIHHMLAEFEMHNVFADRDRYPEVSLEEIISNEVNAVLLSSEPFPFKQDHMEIFEDAGIKTILVDGALCSWYGSRMKDSWAYLSALNERI